MKELLGKIGETLGNVSVAVRNALHIGSKVRRDEIGADVWADFVHRLPELQRAGHHGLYLLQVDADFENKVYPQDRFIESFENLKKSLITYVDALCKNSSQELNHIKVVEEQGKKFGYLIPENLKNLPWTEDGSWICVICLSNIKEKGKIDILIEPENYSIGIANQIDGNASLKYHACFEFKNDNVLLNHQNRPQYVRPERFTRHMRSKHTFNFANENLEEYIANINKLSDAAEWITDKLNQEIERLNKT